MSGAYRRDARSNTLSLNNAGDAGKANTGDGIRLLGSGNTLMQNTAFANGANGLEIYRKLEQRVELEPR